MKNKKIIQPLIVSCSLPKTFYVYNLEKFDENVQDLLYIESKVQNTFRYHIVHKSLLVGQFDISFQSFPK